MSFCAIDFDPIQQLRIAGASDDDIASSCLLQARFIS